MKTFLLCAGSAETSPGSADLFPRNLREIAGEPLLSHVIENLGELGRDGRLVAVVRREEAQAAHTARVIQLIEPTADVLSVGSTDGAACSALLGVDRVAPDEELLLCNGDQILSADLSQIVGDFSASDLDAGVVVFDAVHPRYSYVRMEGDLVIEASEKRPISRDATAGFYWFRRAEDFFQAAQRMITKGAAVNGSYYVCPSLNELILAGKRVGIRRIQRNQYWSLREDQDVLRYETHLRVSSSVPPLEIVEALLR